MATKTVYTFEALKEFRVRTLEGKRIVKKGDTFEVEAHIAKVLKKSYKKYCEVVDIEEVTKASRDQLKDLGVKNSSAFDEVRVEGEEEVLEEDTPLTGAQCKEILEKAVEDGKLEKYDKKAKVAKLRALVEEVTKEENLWPVEGAEGKGLVAEDDLAKRARLFQEAEAVGMEIDKISPTISTEDLEAEVQKAIDAGEEEKTV